MATSGRGSGVVGYNVQVAVDTKHHLIVTHEVTNSGSDRAQLANVASQAKEVLGVDKLEAIPVRGYFTAVVSTMTDPQAFRTGREFAAWVGLVPQQNSTGGKERLGSISKQGDSLSAATIRPRCHIALSGSHARGRRSTLG